MTESTDDTHLAELLQTLARADPDFPRFEQAHAGLGQVAIAPPQQAAIARDLLALLRESPGQAARIEALSRSRAPESFHPGLAAVPILLAAAFLARTHVRFQRHADGNYELLVEHKPADNQALAQLLATLSRVLPTGG